MFFSPYPLRPLVERNSSHSLFFCENLVVLKVLNRNIQKQSIIANRVIFEVVAIVSIFVKKRGVCLGFSESVIEILV